MKLKQAQIYRTLADRNIPDNNPEFTTAECVELVVDWGTNQKTLDAIHMDTSARLGFNLFSAHNPVGKGLQSCEGETWSVIHAYLYRNKRSKAYRQGDKSVARHVYQMEWQEVVTMVLKRDFDKKIFQLPGGMRANTIEYIVGMDG